MIHVRIFDNFAAHIGREVGVLRGLALKEFLVFPPEVFVFPRFRQCGLRFSLDDFGSKYANMQIFASVKFDTVKLDRSLIAGMVGNPINGMLVQDIIRICQTCGMVCVAEGVETREQACALQEMGCHCAQGYYFDRPLPAKQFQQKYLQGREPARQS